MFHATPGELLQYRHSPPTLYSPPNRLFVRSEDIQVWAPDGPLKACLTLLAN